MLNRATHVGVALLLLGAGTQLAAKGIGLALLGFLVLVCAACLEAMRRRRLPVGVPLPWPVFVVAAGVCVAGSACGWHGAALKEMVQACLLLGGGCIAAGVLTQSHRQTATRCLAVILALNLAAAAWQRLHPGSAAVLLQALYGAPYPTGTGPDLSVEIATGLLRSQLQFALFVSVALPVLLWLRPPGTRGQAAAAMAAVTVAVLTVLPPPFTIALFAASSCQIVYHRESGPPNGRRLWMLCLGVVCSMLLLARTPEGARRRDYMKPFTWSGTDQHAPKRLVIETEAALHSLHDHPLGWGPGSYRTAVRRATSEAGLPKPQQNRVRTDGNGQWLLLAVEGGIPVLAGLLWVLIAAGRRAMRLPERSRAGPESAVIAVGIGAATTSLLAVGTGPAVWTGMGLLLLPSPTTPVTARSRLRTTLLQAGILAVALILPWAAGGRSRLERPALRQVAALAAADFFMEAEAADRIEPPFEGRAANHTGGNRCLSLPKGSGKGVGSAEFTLTPPGPGTYKVWIRALWEGGCANSVGISIGDSPPVAVEDAIFERWHWVDIAPEHLVELPAGPFTLRLSNTEDGVHIDQIAFLADPTAMPLGILRETSPPEPVPEDHVPPTDDDPVPEGTGLLILDDDLPEDEAFDKYDEE